MPPAAKGNDSLWNPAIEETLGPHFRAWVVNSFKVAMLQPNVLFLHFNCNYGLPLEWRQKNHIITERYNVMRYT